MQAVQSPVIPVVAELIRQHPGTISLGQGVVFYRTPERNDDALIKRVIGLPGDTIEFRSGHVLINGAQLEEPYVGDAPTSCSANCGPLVLGADQYFVLGDNRLNSLDSRSFGPIPADQIVGRVALRYWPLNQIEIFP